MERILDVIDLATETADRRKRLVECFAVDRVGISVEIPFEKRDASRITIVTDADDRDDLILHSSETGTECLVDLILLMLDTDMGQHDHHVLIRAGNIFIRAVQHEVSQHRDSLVT